MDNPEKPPSSPLRLTIMDIYQPLVELPLHCWILSSTQNSSMSRIAPSFQNAWDLVTTTLTPDTTLASLDRPAPIRSSSSPARTCSQETLERCGRSNSSPSTRSTSTNRCMASDRARQVSELRYELRILQASVSGVDDPRAQQLLLLTQRLESLDLSTSSSRISTSELGSSASPSAGLGTLGDISQSRTADTHTSSSSNGGQAECRCWESCCVGRVFSNKSNLVRHQRERSSESAPLKCSFCSAEYSRSSARNAHEAKRTCRGEGRG